MRTTHLFSAALISSALLTMAACGNASDSGEASGPAGDSIEIHDAWVKAEDEGMSAAFGGIENTADTDATVVSAASEASNGLELHETVENEAGEMVMREKTGGFTIAGGQTLALEPGGNHIMLMDLAAPLRAGEEVTFTLRLSDDSTFEFTAPVKDYAGANENYQGGDESEDHDGHDVDEHDGHGQ